MSHLCSHHLPALTDDASAWDLLCDALRSLVTRRGGRLKYVPNEGKLGGAQIGAGSWQFFGDIELYPECSARQKLHAGDAAVYGGGGDSVPGPNGGLRHFLERCLAVNVASALVLPQTIRGHEGVLAQLDDRFTLACRDTASVLSVQASGTRAHLLLAPDMALYLDVAQLFKRCESHRSPPSANFEPVQTSTHAESPHMGGSLMRMTQRHATSALRNSTTQARGLP